MKIHKYKSIPDVTEVAKDIYKIVIPQPFYEPNNIYVIKSGEPALIDGGFVLNLGLLQRALGKIGLSLSKIKHVFFTHDHIDHISSALTLRYYTDAKQYGMQRMAHTIGDYIKHIGHFQRAMNRLIYKAISDSELRKKEIEISHKGWAGFLSAVYNSDRVDPVLKMDIELVEGDVIDIGGRLLGFLHTPGHNKWHLSPYVVGEGIYFTGDLVLKNISSIYAEVDGNLAYYQNSLERLLNLPISRLLPAHGEEPEDPKRNIKILLKTLSMLERGVIRRLKHGMYDLNDLATEAMGEKIKSSPYYIVALAIIHSIILKLLHHKQIKIHEIDPPYEKYEWIGSE